MTDYVYIEAYETKRFVAATPFTFTTSVIRIAFGSDPPCILGVNFSLVGICLQF